MVPQFDGFKFWSTVDIDIVAQGFENKWGASLSMTCTNGFTHQENWNFIGWIFNGVLHIPAFCFIPSNRNLFFMVAPHSQIYICS